MENTSSHNYETRFYDDKFTLSFYKIIEYANNKIIPYDTEIYEYINYSLFSYFYENYKNMKKDEIYNEKISMSENTIYDLFKTLVTNSLQNILEYLNYLIENIFLNTMSVLILFSSITLALYILDIKIDNNLIDKFEINFNSLIGSREIDHLEIKLNTLLLFSIYKKTYNYKIDFIRLLNHKLSNYINTYSLKNFDEYKINLNYIFWIIGKDFNPLDTYFDVLDQYKNKIVLDNTIYRYQKIISTPLINYNCYILNNLFNYDIEQDIIIGSPIKCSEDCPILSKYKSINFYIKYYKNRYYITNNYNDEINENIYILEKDNILEYMRTEINFNILINRFKLFLNLEQVMFVYSENKIHIILPEFDIKIIYNLDLKSDNLNQIVFGNLNIILDLTLNNKTKLINNLICNCPNMFLLYNSLDDKYFVLNILTLIKRELDDLDFSYKLNQEKFKDDEIEYDDNLKYYDIIEIHYSNSFLIFNNNEYD
jgi:hypothetical protein